MILARPTICYISESNLRHNFGEIRRLCSENCKSNPSIMSVVKSNGYGHDDKLISKILSDEKTDSFGVATLNEALNLRDAGINEPIFILGGLYEDDFEKILDYDLTPLVYDLEIANKLNGFASKKNKVVNIHLKIDTGMGRLGFLPDESRDNLEECFNEIKNLPNIKVTGIMTHLSEAEESREDFSKIQFGRFKNIIATAKKVFGAGLVTHIANSSAIMDFPVSTSSFALDMIRPGIMLYGAYPEERFKGKINLKPVMELKTKVLQVRKVGKDFPVSYKRTFKTTKESTIATLPIGYGDGLKRGLSGQGGHNGGGEVLINGTRCPIIGLICMDLCVVDVSHLLDTVRVGDEAVIIGSQTGSQGTQTITAEDIALKLGTISYEIFCQITKRVPRVIV